MSRYLPIALIASVGFVFSACESTKPNNTTDYPQGASATGHRPPSIPEPSPSPVPGSTSQEIVTNQPPVEVDPTPTPVPIPAVADYPTAVAVEGKPGFVRSLNGSGIVDVRGYPPGTEVTDPYSGKVFLVP